MGARSLPSIGPSQKGRPALEQGNNVKLQGLQEYIRRDSSYRAFVARAQEIVFERAGDGRFPALSLGLLTAARPYVLAALQRDWPGPVIVIASRPEQARLLHDEARAWSVQPERVLMFPPPDALFYDRTPWHPETIHGRVSVLAELSALAREGIKGGGQGLIVTTSVWALMVKTISPLAFRRATFALYIGQIEPPYELIARCIRAGYEPVAVVEEPGTISHRGSIVDIYPPNLSEPLRIDFFGDEIDSMRTFDPATQRSIASVQEATIAPATEALPEWGKAAKRALEALELASCNSATRQRLAEQRSQLIEGTYFAGIEFYLPYLYPRPNTLLDLAPQNALILMDDIAMLEAAGIGLENQAIALRAEMIDDGELPPNIAVPYVGWEEVRQRLAARGAIDLGHSWDDAELEEASSSLERAFVSAPRYAGQVHEALSEVVELRKSGHHVVLVSRQAERLSDLLREQNVFVAPSDAIGAPADIAAQALRDHGALHLIDGILAEGWVYRPLGEGDSSGQLALLTDAEVFGWQRIRRERSGRVRRSAPESLFADLQEGDYVVHVEHGIGRYHGMVHKTIGKLEREYLEIEYANGDRLYVPIHQADRVSRYLGADDREPRIHRLGGAEWPTVRAKAERAIRDMAAELLELYAAREITPGFSFSPDNEWQRELEGSFPYEETADQLRALAEIKADMEKPRPMDRLVCGDVGYGKTEVALRAAFKAVMDGKQVAILVPTTVLAQQHYYTFRRRLRAFPVVVEMLSRFRTPQEQRQVLDDLAAGRVDIIIGTHRLLSGDVTFRDLGLVIIDEEQRFGVSHKEHLKRMRREVDVLTMTATPIPRTMYMSLSGIRDMSIIDTPPEDRLPIRTYVAEEDEGLIRKAILRELDRGGQVYYVHNRVYDIELVAAMLQRVVPEASLVIGHGQMPEEELAQVMLGFAQGEYDILLCTTIIESGLDIPNVNTIIIDGADTLGLAQLYQLRGRVGRGVERAYAYLLYKPPLSEVAHQRLETIREAAELGAGYRVALRDMEIRGAGEILGAEQHGHIAAIGFELYSRLLRQAVEELRASYEGSETRSAASREAARRAQEKTAARFLAVDVGPSIDLPVSAYLPDDFVPDHALRLRLYRRLARIEEAAEIDALEQEMSDRFGELPDPVRGLLFLLRVRVLADQAGIQAVTGDAHQIALALPLLLPSQTASDLMARFPDIQARGTRIWLPITPADGIASESWQHRLLHLLESLAALVPV